MAFKCLKKFSFTGDLAHKAHGILQ